MSEAFPLKVENDQAVMHLTSILDMSTADELLASLRTVDKTLGKLTLDAVDVERISTPCVQVILSASIKFEQSGRSFAIKNASAAFERGLTELGLSEYLEKWSKN